MSDGNSVMTKKIELLIIDDYPVVLSGLISMFKNHQDINVVGVATTGRKAVDLALALRPQIMLMNIDMPEMDGIAATRLIKESVPEIRVIMFSGVDNNEKVTLALTAGVVGYIPKNVSEPELVGAIRQVAKGDTYIHPSVIGYVLQQIKGEGRKEQVVEKLTERELDVLKYMSHGYSNIEIARLMTVSQATVHTHVSHILAKLQVSSRTQAVIYAMREGIVPELGADNTTSC